MAAVFVDVPFDSIDSSDAVDLISFDFGTLATSWPPSSSAVSIAAHRFVDQLTAVRLASDEAPHAANVSEHPVAVTTDSDTDWKRKEMQIQTKKTFNDMRFMKAYIRLKCFFIHAEADVDADAEAEFNIFKNIN